MAGSADAIPRYTAEEALARLVAGNARFVRGRARFPSVRKEVLAAVYELKTGRVRFLA